ncbi:protein phosphatase CheZ [uncultured Methylobacterium sp.]|uniref:protein phosphatase CheZ n=1 Tax=uncultured Methylobacterium sp. TaxID=157278 RepID=UPI002591540C|nr:protein phosphatase CheZ [uncultured Methylobacterium sp.]
MDCISPAPAPVLVEEQTALLQRHLLTISDAIVRTREEIAELRQEQDAGRARDELQAVVQGTERATNTILGASETVDDLARRIVRGAADEATRGHAAAIQAQMQTVFVACNFQDLTGQRISKVVRTIAFIEDRVAEMLRVWGAGAAPAAARSDRRRGEDALLNGPALPDVAAVSQDAVDALFA